MPEKDKATQSYIITLKWMKTGERGKYMSGINLEIKEEKKTNPKVLQLVEFWAQILIGSRQNENLQERYLLHAWDIKEDF